MHSVRVHTTSTTAHRQRTTGRAGIARVAQATRSSRPAPTYGHCLRCGGIEVRLTIVVGVRDYSRIGESSRYPVGHGCECCS
jgi:hypothetical protein